MRGLWIAIAVLAACDEPESSCTGIRCPELPAAHPAGPLFSLQGGRQLSITGDVVEVREPDGTTSRYRLKQSTAFDYPPVSQCGERSPAFYDRSFEIVSVSATTVVMHVRAEQGARFVDHVRALVTSNDGMAPSTTTRAEDGSFLEVAIEMSSNVSVELEWRIELATSESVHERIRIGLVRECTGSCPSTPPNVYFTEHECL